MQGQLPRNKQKAYRAGAKAYSKGQSRDSNPYKTPGYRMFWERGFDERKALEDQLTAIGDALEKVRQALYPVIEEFGAWAKLVSEKLAPAFAEASEKINQAYQQLPKKEKENE